MHVFFLLSDILHPEKNEINLPARTVACFYKVGFKKWCYLDSVLWRSEHWKLKLKRSCHYYPCNGCECETKCSNCETCLIFAIDTGCDIKKELEPIQQTMLNLTTTIYNRVEKNLRIVFIFKLSNLYFSGP